MDAQHTRRKVAMIESDVESRTQRSRPRTQKKTRGQGPNFREQTLSRQRTEMVEAKYLGHNFSKLW